MSTAISINVGSKNPVKVNAVNAVFSALFPEYEVQCVGFNVDSKVSEQPMTQTETRQGALNRVTALRNSTQADYYVAIEGGVDEFVDGPATFAYLVIHDGNQQSVGRSGQLPLPTAIYQRLVKGEELGPVMDDVFGTSNVKQKGGAIGLLTNNALSRQAVYQQGLIMAMAPFLLNSHYER